jgi:hypothetical protein
MTPEARAELTENAAKAMWVAVTDLKAEFRESVWAGTHPRASAYLQDEDSPEDENSEESKPFFLCPIGRNTFRRMADAAIAVVLEEAARQCSQQATEKWTESQLAIGQTICNRILALGNTNG